MLRHFIRYYRPHLPLFILDFTCAFIMSMMDLVFPIVVMKMIDDVFPSQNLLLIMWIGLGMLVLYIVRAGLQYIVDYWGHVLGVRMEYDMRRDLFKHIHKLSFNYFNNTKTGHIMSRLVNDLSEISELAHHGPEDLFIVTVTLLGSFIIMSKIHLSLTLITFSVVPIIIVFTLIKNRKMQNAFRELRVEMGEINSQVEDSIAGARVVKSFTNEKYEEEKFEIGNNNFKESKENTFKVMASFFSGVNFFANFIHLVVLIFGGMFIYQGSMKIGELTGFLLYVSMFLQPIRKLSILVENYQKGMAGFHRFWETLQLVPEIVDAPNAFDLVDVKGGISFENVTFSYNNKKNILKDISFYVKPGESLAIVGPSGGGKTTLCNLIPRFYEVDEGVIKIDGHDITQLTLKSLRENIGMVQQDVFLFSGTIRENIAYGKIDATDEEIIAASKRANAHEFIMSLENGYDTHIGERGVMLSGGQKQRISIARIFLKNPPILILDEATSALDNETERVIQESLKELSENRTTLIIAHRLATIKNADRIMVLTDEGIVEEGSHKALLKENGIYRKLYNAQFKDGLSNIA